MSIKFTYEGNIDDFDRLTGRNKPADQAEQNNQIAQIAAAFSQYQKQQQEQIEALRAQVRSLPLHQLPLHQFPPAPTAQHQLTPQQLAAAYLPPARPEFVMPPTRSPEYVAQPQPTPHYPTQPVQPQPQQRAITVDASEVLPPPPPPTIQPTQAVTELAIAATATKPNPLSKWFFWSLTQPGIVAFYLALIASVGFAIARHAPIVNHWLSIKQPSSVTQPAKPPAKPPQK